MKSKKLTKVILFSAAFLSCAMILIWIQLWIQLFTLVPPEHVYIHALFPDGSKIARFSVRYQGIHPWLPTDIEPYCYVTIVDTKWGGILLRKTEYHGDIKNTFTELARRYAPWAVEQVASKEWGSCQ